MESIDQVKTRSEGIKRKAGRLLAFTLMTVLVSAAATETMAQTWREFFSQKKTQKKYLLQQIAALQTYISYAKKGYNITSTGISTIKDIKNGEFDLHNAFFNSLKTVSPLVRKNVKIAEIIDLQQSITKNLNGIGDNASLSQADREYIASVRKKVLEECAADLEALLLIVTSGRLEMTDDQRINRLDNLYAAMRDKSAFTQSFCNGARLLIRQKADEKQAIQLLKTQYEITD